ncbi:unnamed protein product [Spirodela intermedia]|uniref:RRM domain-containing protein n=1 Tax=Spirodela intermedia TaxID=51605 RepID=A0A7I8JS34_SPIIN|nr:unnamed protein product [Spirodela intermedia]CAA6672934.1 unnamed protein product [Spirodela intermedia]
MDLGTKKGKADENGGFDGAPSLSKLSPADARKIIESFSKEHLLDIVQEAACRHLNVLKAVRAVANGLCTLFSTNGDLEEAVVIIDKNTGKSKGYGFISFRHIDGALLALKERSKKIDGRMTLTCVSKEDPCGKLPQDMPADRLLAHFCHAGRSRKVHWDLISRRVSRGGSRSCYWCCPACRWCFESACHQCRARCCWRWLGMGGHPPLQGPMSGQFGVPEGSLPMVGPLRAPVEFRGLQDWGNHHLNSSMPSSIGMGMPGLSSVGGQVLSTLGGGGAGGYGSSLGGPSG